jgi:hypothetical protein
MPAMRLYQNPFDHELVNVSMTLRKQTLSDIRTLLICAMVSAKHIDPIVADEIVVIHNLLLQVADEYEEQFNAS